MAASDFDLLSAFVRDHDAKAFEALALRHGDWLFVAARRRVRDDHLADDVRQTVLLLLAEKAAHLLERDVHSLSAWLFQVMHFTCARMMRTRSRRLHHETAAGRLKLQSRECSAGLDEQAVRMLEDTLAQLSAPDREAIVRRYYQRQDFAAIGEALGSSAEAIRKRVGRALVTCRMSMLGDGLDALPAEMLDAISEHAPTTAAGVRRAAVAVNRESIETLAKATMTLIEEMQPIDFPMMSAEFFVTDIEANLDFFEKLGFTRRFVDEPDATGLPPRASLRGGAARVWLRRAAGDDNTRPTAGVMLYFWMNGGEVAIRKHRDALAARGVAVNPYFFDKAFLNFTVTTPDGYAIGFFSMYEPTNFAVREFESPTPA